MREIISTRRYAAGYEVRTIRLTGDDAMGSEPFDIKSAYTPAGIYIGDPKRAHMLCKKRGIAPEKSKEDHNICSIGFCKADQKWYGWSHRAIFGFGVGSEVKQGDCGYMPTDKDDFLADCVRFWDGEHHDNTTGEHSENIPEFIEYAEDCDSPPMRGEELSSPDALVPIGTTYGEKEYGVQVNWTYSDDTPNKKIRGTISGIFSAYPETWGRGEWVANTLMDAKQMAVDFAEGVA